MLKLPCPPPSAQGWSGLQLQLKQRLQLHRVTQLRCRYSTLLDEKTGGVDPAYVFASCRRLALVDDRGTSDGVSLDLRASFPHVLHVHIAFALPDTRDYRALLDHTAHADNCGSNDSDVSGLDDATAPPDFGICERRRRLMNTRLNDAPGAASLVLRAQTLVSHGTHLRLSSNYKHSVVLSGEWPQLESLETFRSIHLVVSTSVSMPRLERLVVINYSPRIRRSLRRLVRGAPALASFFYSYWHDRALVDLLKKHCPLLRTLHCADSGLPEDHMELAAYPNLVELAIYRFRVGRPLVSMDDLAQWLTPWFAQSQLRRFVAIEETPRGTPTWHSVRLTNSVRTSVVYFGSFAS